MFEVITEKLAEVNLVNKTFPRSFGKDGHIAGIDTPEEFYTAFIDLTPSKTRIIEAASPAEIDGITGSVEAYEITNIINIKRINAICSLEEFLQSVNDALPLKGMFICHAETTEQRYKRIMNAYPASIALLLYTFDFLLKRVLPKWGLTKKLFLFFDKKGEKVLSLSHILGLFAFYGFKVNYLKDINNLTYFAFEKEKKPCGGCKPPCGVLFKTERVGMGGSIIKLYKLRTMHPYSEYIQQFVYDLNGSENGDKINGDFRVASWGRHLRKYWIDELPMLINWLKGDLKLVGVRPLSRCKFGLYPPELQELRIRCKPGLIPPFYADMPKNFEELVESERKYLQAYKVHPVKTDVKYFYRCLYNIVIKRARSA